LFGPSPPANTANTSKTQPAAAKHGLKVQQTSKGPDQKKLGVAGSSDDAKLEAKASELLRACACVCECCGAKASEAGLS